jgi:hypothetical protein
LIGYHNYSDSVRKWAELKHPIRSIRNNLSIESLFLIEDEVIQKLFEKEKRLSVKAKKYFARFGGVPSHLPQWYFGLKRRLVRDVIENNLVSRNGSLCPVKEYYGLTTDYSLFPESYAQTKSGIPLGGIVLPGSVQEKLLIDLKR